MLFSKIFRNMCMYMYDVGSTCTIIWEYIGPCVYFNKMTNKWYGVQLQKEMVKPWYIVNLLTSKTINLSTNSSSLQYFKLGLWQV